MILHIKVRQTYQIITKVLLHSLLLFCIFKIPIPLLSRKMIWSSSTSRMSPEAVSVKEDETVFDKKSRFWPRKAK